jgi:putative DNA primase/helicase
MTDNARKKASQQEERGSAFAQDSSAEARAKKLEEQYYRESKQLPDGYEYIDDKIFFRVPAKKDDELDKLVYVCSELEVIAYLRDEKNRNHGRLLIFPDVDGHWHECSISMDLLAGDGTHLRAQLLNRGLRIGAEPKARQYLSTLIQESMPCEKVRCVSQIGWYKNRFVMTSEVIGDICGERVLFQGTGEKHHSFVHTGTLEEWKEQVSKFCKLNSRLTFAACCGFAPPLLCKLGIENGGIHYIGSSSIGKTTAQKVAVSIWNSTDNLLTWRATSNGLEAVAKEHNDCLLCLDELSQVDPAEAGNIAYMLANGMGKLRSNVFGDGCKNANWRLLFLSTGEVGLSQHMSEGGKKTRPGQEVRLTEIPADTGVHGVFEELHGYENGASLSHQLTEACRHYNGVAAREFIKKLIEDGFAWQRVEQMIEAYKVKLTPQGASGQVLRTARRFALIIAAGELATAYGITGWNEGDAFWAGQKCFDSWIQARGGIGLKEEANVLSQIRLFFQLHGESRFSLWGNFQKSEDLVDLKTCNRAGFRKRTQDGSY